MKNQNKNRAGQDRMADINREIAEAQTPRQAPLSPEGKKSRSVFLHHMAKQILELSQQLEKSTSGQGVSHPDLTGALPLLNQLEVTVRDSLAPFRTKAAVTPEAPKKNVPKKPAPKKSLHEALKEFSQRRQIVQEPKKNLTEVFEPAEIPVIEGFVKTHRPRVDHFKKNVETDPILRAERPTVMKPKHRPAK